MDLILKIFLLVSTLFLLVLVFRTIKKRTISVRYALMWLIFTTVLLSLVIFPEVVKWISVKLHFESESNLVFVAIIASLILMLLSITILVSKQAERIQILTQEVAILKRKTDSHIAEYKEEK